MRSFCLPGRGKSHHGFTTLFLKFLRIEFHSRLKEGIKLGKPEGIIQASMYDKDKEKILHLYQLGVPIQKIIATHLG